MVRDWTREEVEATVADYLAMLHMELAGIPFNKTEHRHRLARVLDRRSDGAIERKHQNISAVLRELGLPCIDGYKPLPNYQRLLFEVVAEVIGRADRVIAAVASQAEAPAEVPSVDDILASEVPAPLPAAAPASCPHEFRQAALAGRKVNYLLREAANQSLGSAGEEFVVRFETARLIAAGAERLAAMIERVSVTSGDTAGYDVLSFEADTRERLIEVKTTAFGRDTPFFVSRHEVDISRKERERYRVYRLFNFRRDPRFFQRCGQIDAVFHLEPAQYEARV